MKRAEKKRVREKVIRKKGSGVVFLGGCHIGCRRPLCTNLAKHIQDDSHTACLGKLMWHPSPGRVAHAVHENVHRGGCGLLAAMACVAGVVGRACCARGVVGWGLIEGVEGELRGRVEARRH